MDTKPTRPVESVIVLIDYENVQRTATRRFLPTGSGHGGVGYIHPRAVAELLVEKRQRDSYLKEVRVYRGQPNPHKQPPQLVLITGKQLTGKTTRSP